MKEYLFDLEHIHKRVLYCIPNFINNVKWKLWEIPTLICNCMSKFEISLLKKYYFS